MWQMRFCPSCGARTTYGERFCGNCGVNLACAVQQVPAQSYDYQYPYQQLQQYDTPCNQPAAPVDANRCQQPYAASDDINATPISAEISRLLADLFDKRLKHEM